MKQIPLTKGYFALVDDEDFEWLNQWKWHASVKSNTVYADRTTKDKNGRKTTLRMHRVVLGVTDRVVVVDHGDGNGLNNTRDNIRICTNAQNMMNKRAVSGSTSKFKGVCWSDFHKRWVAAIRVGCKTKHLGYFNSQEDAARAYNQWAKDAHGEFARLNDVFPILPNTEWEQKVLLRNNSSGFRGVSFNKRRGKWVARVHENDTSVFLGYFSAPIEAARAYDAKAREFHGNDARLNFPEIDA